MNRKVCPPENLPGTKNRLAYIFAALLLSSIVFPGLQQLVAQRAYADGFNVENLPPASIGDRLASLYIRVNPPVLTSTTQQNAYMQFRLFDAKTNNTIPWTTYHITVTKGIRQSERPILEDFFQAANGLLTLKIEPSNQPIQIQGNQEPFLGAWVADPNGNVNVIGPVFLEAGLYHFHVEIFTVDSPRTIFIPEQAPNFDAWLSVGDVTTHDLQYNGQTYNSTLISYYDQTNNFNFNPATKTISWTMPFDWNTTRLQSVNVFVHEELRLPKALSALTATNNFNATTNGFSITGRQLAIDPYSFPDALTLHYLLNKNDIIAMSRQVPPGTKDMAFSLSPGTSGAVQTSSDLTTDTGGIHVTVNWSPSQLAANSQSTVKVNFSDAFTGGPLNADVKYDLAILDDKGNQVYSKSDLVARGGTDTQTITFPKDDTYHIQVKIKELDRQGQSPDMTRNGVARGIVVVPEFPAGAVFAVIAVVFAATIVASRKFAAGKNWL